MTTHRRYFFQHPGTYTGGRHDEVKRLLQHYCERYWWYNDPDVTGAAFDRLTFSLKVSARDQWACHKRAMYVAYRCYELLGFVSEQVPEPMWETLPPHENRGRYRVSPDQPL